MGKQILLVEDEPVIAISEKKQLENYGYSVHHVNTGEKAVLTILDNSHQIDLILMDINLGSGIDGTQAAKQILNHRDIPVVFLSSHTDPEVVDKTGEITSYGYVVKNSSISVLNASIKMAFRLFDAKQKVIEHDSRYHEIVENSPNGISLQEMIYDDTGNPVDYRFLAFNRAFEKMAGVERENVVGKTALEAFPDIEQHWIDTLGKVAKTGESLIVENYTQAFDKYVQVIAFQTEGNRVVTLVRDISELRKAEAENRLLADIVRRSKDFIGVADLEGNAFYVNPAGLAMIGLEKEEEATLTKIQDYFFPEDLDTVEKTIIPTVRKEGQWAGEFRFRHFRTGNPVYVHYNLFQTQDPATGEIHNLATISRDITELKQMEERFRQIIDEYDTVFHGTQDAMFLVDVLDDDTYRYIRNNRAHVEATGLTTEALANKTPQELLGKEMADEVTANYRRCVHATTSISYEETLELPGGLRIWNTTLTPVVHQGSIKYLVGSAQDITERKRAEEEIQRQLAEKETLLKEVHHRIKNNMAQVESLLLLQADSTNSLDVKSALYEAMSRIRSIRELYEKLLIGNGYEEVSVKEYLESMIDSVEEVFNNRPGITIEKKIVDFTLSPKEAVPVGIIINELLTNVFKYAFIGHDSGHISVELIKTGTQATLTITDNGIGIDTRVFENKNPGFGLTIVKMLAEQLEGTFIIENNKGTRSVLEFEL